MSTTTIDYLNIDNALNGVAMVAALKLETQHAQQDMVKRPAVDQDDSISALWTFEALVEFEAGVNFQADIEIQQGIEFQGVAEVATGGKLVLPETPIISSNATGTTGTVAWGEDYVYVCVATDTWKRAALSTW